MKKILLSTAYLPNIQYFRAIYQNSEIIIEQYESFPKQSFRNRTQIMTEAGIMNLSVPLIKVNSKQLTKDIKISYKENWQAKHWHAIVSAYNSSPFFEYFRDDFERFFKEKFEYLLDFNNEINKVIFNILGIQKDIKFSEDFVKIDSENPACEDLRFSIHPKIEQKENVNYYNSETYPQVFDSKMDFIPNLSIIDAIFNIGEETINYLKN